METKNVLLYFIILLCFIIFIFYYGHNLFSCKFFSSILGFRLIEETKINSFLDISLIAYSISQIP